MSGPISNATPVAEILTNVLNFLLSIVGIVGIIGLVVTGILYFTAAGDERKIHLAKVSFYASVTGLVISLGALVILNLLSSFFS